MGRRGQHIWVCIIGFVSQGLIAPTSAADPGSSFNDCYSQMTDTGTGESPTFALPKLGAGDIVESLQVQPFRFSSSQSPGPVEEAVDITTQVQAQVAKDSATVSNHYVSQSKPDVQGTTQDLSPSQQPITSIPMILERFDTAQKDLAEVAERLDTPTVTVTGLDDSDRVRFRNTLLNAADKAEAARELLIEAQKEETMSAVKPFNFLDASTTVTNTKPRRSRVQMEEDRTIAFLKPTKKQRGTDTDLLAAAPEKSGGAYRSSAPSAADVWNLPAEQATGALAASGLMPNPLAKTVLNGEKGARKELAELFGANKPYVASNTEDALVNRTALYWGLPQSTRDEVSERLNFLEKIKLTTPDGKAQTVPILHNGYLLGGGETGMDCSSFVSSILPASVRKGRYTTLDFKAMYALLQTGKIPSPPKYQKNRELWIRKVSASFEALSLYEGAQPRSADLLVFRSELVPKQKARGLASQTQVPESEFGHVFLVESYNAKRKVAQVIEASQSATTLRKRKFDLSLTPHDQKVRPIRPGLMLLRLRNSGPQSCQVGGGS